MARPPRLKLWLKRIATVVGVAVLVVAAVIGFLYLRCTSAVGIYESQAVKTSAANEAKRKLALFQSSNRRGYVRLTEAEMNAYLDELVADGTLMALTNTTNTTNTAAAARIGVSLLRSRIYLVPEGFLWNCWLKTKLGPLAPEVAWQRLFRVARVSNRWEAELSAMTLGRQRVPRWAWPWAEKVLGQISQPFHNKFNWLANAPAVEIKTNDLSLRLELKLFNYPDTNVLIEANK